MRVLHAMKKSAAFFMSALLIYGLCGCGLSESARESTSEMMSTQEVTDTEGKDSDYVKNTVELPDGFETMRYPLEALAVEYYTQGSPYYSKDGDAESFWFSMAVLSSLMTEDGILQPDYDDEYYYYSKGEIDALASVLYHECALDLSCIPDITSDNPYAVYDKENDRYGLRNGNVGDLSICITQCQKNEQAYDVDYQLKTTEEEEVICQFQVTVMAEEHHIQDTSFRYSITDFSLLDDGSISQEDESELDSFSEEDYDVIDGQEIVDDSDVLKDQLQIERKEALQLAQDYMGDDVEFTYKQLVTIGDYQYYDFAVEGGSGKATDVLVCTNGMDILSGIHNDDGSWSFEQ